MHRIKLLEGLAVYRETYKSESGSVDRFTDFVESSTNCFSRENLFGHVTGSAWILSPDHTKVLLTHHKKLNRWLQLGGHSDGESNTLQVAMREAKEESSLVVNPVDDLIFDIDIHEIPVRGSDPQHLHFDVRFLFESTGTKFRVSSESNALSWAPLMGLEKYSIEESVLRMREKQVERFSRV